MFLAASGMRSTVAQLLFQPLGISSAAIGALFSEQARFFGRFEYLRRWIGRSFGLMRHLCAWIERRFESMEYPQTRIGMDFCPRAFPLAQIVYRTRHFIPLEHAKAWTPNAARPNPDRVRCPAFRLPREGSPRGIKGIALIVYSRRLRGRSPAGPQRFFCSEWYSPGDEITRRMTPVACPPVLRFKKCSLLFGLFQYQSDQDGRRWRVFYVPFGKGKTPRAAESALR